MIIKSATQNSFFPIHHNESMRFIMPFFFWHNYMGFSQNHWLPFFSFTLPFLHTQQNDATIYIESAFECWQHENYATKFGWRILALGLITNLIMYKIGSKSLTYWFATSDSLLFRLPSWQIFFLFISFLLPWKEIGRFFLDETAGVPYDWFEWGKQIEMVGLDNE